MWIVGCYVATLLVFCAIDAAWLTTMGGLIYRPVLGDILLSSVRIGPAIAFYAIFPIGLIVFATWPALRAGSVLPAAGYGALFGALAYATYDLTNYATLRVWSLQITLIDIGYGAVVAGIGATAGYFAARALTAH